MEPIKPRDILIDLDGGGADGKGVETGTMDEQRP